MLNQQDRFREAITAVQEAKSRSAHLSPFSRSTVKCIEPHVLECALHTNLELYHDASQMADQLMDRLAFNVYVPEHKQIAIECELSLDAALVGLPVLRVCLQDYHNNISRIEANFGKTPALFDLVNIAARWMRPDRLAPELKAKVYSRQAGLAEAIIASSVMSLLAKDILEFLVFRCELRNNAAFNWAELNINLDHAKSYSTETVEVMQNLLEQIVPMRTSEDYETRSQVKRHLITQDPVAQIVSNYEDRLAQFYDTLAWVLYRKGDAASLNDAYLMLTEKALRYGINVAVVHYHLARICLTRLENLWQSLSEDARHKATMGPETAQQVSSLLRQSLLYWRHSHRLDTSGSLYPRLRLVQQRMNEYRNRWTQLQIAPKQDSDK